MIMENQMEKTMQSDMETGIYTGFMGRIAKNLGLDSLCNSCTGYLT